jgi:alpha-beta hydrolase superfamily lysophospholipase
LHSADGLCLQAYAWTPALQPRAALLLVHGLHDHAQRHTALAAALQAEGVAVLALDLRGHGRSGGRPQRIDSLAQALDDIDRAAVVLRERHPGLPLLLHGHSFGGTLAAHAVRQNPSRWAGLVLSSAALQRPAGVSSKAAAVIGRLGDWAPALGLEALQAERMVREPQAQVQLRHDPLLQAGKLPARTVATLLQSVAALDGARLPTPQLLLHGQADTVTDAAGSQAWAARQPQAELLLLPAARHDLQNEPEGQAARARIVEFARARAPGG